jgi:hypothetical protein
MNIEIIRNRLKGGFRPFAVVTSSGDKFPVPHPEFIYLTPALRTVVISDENGNVVVLDPLHVVGLEDIPARKNGKPARKQRPH